MNHPHLMVFQREAIAKMRAVNLGAKSCETRLAPPINASPLRQMQRDFPVSIQSNGRIADGSAPTRDISAAQFVH